MNKAERRAAQEQLARDRAVRGWVFRALSVDEMAEIGTFLEGGPCPPLYRKGYDLAREQLKLGPKDWYEAVGDAIACLGKRWDDEFTSEEDEFVIKAADSVAERPEDEKFYCAVQMKWGQCTLSKSQHSMSIGHAFVPEARRPRNR